MHYTTPSQQINAAIEQAPGWPQTNEAKNEITRNCTAKKRASFQFRNGAADRRRNHIITGGQQHDRVRRIGEDLAAFNMGYEKKGEKWNTSAAYGFGGMVHRGRGGSGVVHAELAPSPTTQKLESEKRQAARGRRREATSTHQKMEGGAVEPKGTGGKNERAAGA